MKQQKQRIAIIGGGVSGLSTAWHLHTSSADDIEVHLFESDNRLGGHAHTLTLDTKNKTCKDATVKVQNDEEKVDVDVGFMVYNKGNYPNMTAWVS
jgi:predicted NAD/FAD-binding protein